MKNIYIYACSSNVFLEIIKQMIKVRNHRKLMKKILFFYKQRNFISVSMVPLLQQLTQIFINNSKYQTQWYHIRLNITTRKALYGFTKRFCFHNDVFFSPRNSNLEYHLWKQHLTLKPDLFNHRRNGARRWGFKNASNEEPNTVVGCFFFWYSRGL